MMTADQKQDAIAIFEKGKRINSIDYVGAWYYKAALMMQSEPDIHAAFVSTNSITQGEQVSPFWGKLLTDYSIHIDFAYRTFKWNSEAKEKAAVHCVIIGFSTDRTNRDKTIYFNDSSSHHAKNINPYTAVSQLFRTAQAEDSQWVPSSLVRDNRREFRLRTN